MNKLILVTALLLVSIAVALHSQQEKIVEEVSVINIEVPVRVYQGKKLVSGLSKDDFRLQVNGKSHPINGFYEFKKRMKRDSVSPDSAQFIPRLFLLIFNISDIDFELKKGMDAFFSKVIQQGDRLMVMTNGFALNDHVVRNLEQEKKRLMSILRLDTARVKREQFEYEMRIRDLTKRLRLELTDPDYEREPEDVVYYLQKFYNQYIVYMNEFKDNYFNLDESQYVAVADYLQRQNVEKWALNFYGILRFPQLKFSGQLAKQIRQFQWDYEGGDSATQIYGMKLYQLQFDIEKALQVADTIPTDNIGKVFLNSGITFHTLLMKSSKYRYLDDLEYKQIATDSENVLRKISTMTGGNVTGENDLDQFIVTTSVQEDIYYMLTYAPNGEDAKAKRRIKVSLVEKSHRVVFDDQARRGYFQELVEKTRQADPQIRVDWVKVLDNTVSFNISRIKMDRDANGTSTGKLRIRMKILDPEARTLQDRKRETLTKLDTFELQVRLPKMKTGRKTLIIEVEDLLTGKNDIALHDFRTFND